MKREGERRGILPVGGREGLRAGGAGGRAFMGF